MIACLIGIVFMLLLAPARAAADSHADRSAVALSRMGIPAQCEIVIGDNPELVEHTAAETLQKILRESGRNARIVTEAKSSDAARFFLGRESSSTQIRRNAVAGELRVREIDPKQDGYHVKQLGKNIVIAGVNPRAVLYGVYAFENYLRAGAEESLDIYAVPTFKTRGSGVSLSHISINVDDVMGRFTEEHAITLSRLGINELTDQAIGGTLSEFVSSEVFPFVKEPDAAFQRHLKTMSAICRKYGIDQYVFLCEPALPSHMGDLSRFPEEALGTARRPWGGAADGLERTLCVSSEIVQEFLRDAMKRFVREYPDIKGVQFYNLDVSAWLCTPSVCERCRKACPDSPPDAFNPWETQARLVSLLAAAAHEVRPDFQFRFWAAVHYHGRQFEKVVEAAKGHDALLSSWTGSDRTVMIPDSATPDRRFSHSQEIAARDGIDFIALCEFHNLEVIPRSLPFPFHVIDALQKYRRWGVTGFSEIFGLEPAHSSVNAIAAREFFWNPDLKAEDFLRDLAQRQFGPEAGASMYRAWDEMRHAFDVWDNVTDQPFPLEGSQFHVKLGPAIGGLPPAITPTGAQYYGEIIDILTRVEPWREADFAWNRSADFLDRMETMRTHLEAAAAFSKQAVNNASDERRVDVFHYPRANGRPSSHAYAELNYAPIAFAAALARERCEMIRAYHLVTERDTAKAKGDTKLADQKEQAFREMVRQSISTLRDFRRLMEEFAVMKPTFERTALTEEDITNFIRKTDEKIRDLEHYLGGT